MEALPNLGDLNPKEALAHITALVKLHQRGVQYHLDHNNPHQAALWERDSIRLQELWAALASLSIT